MATLPGISAKIPKGAQWRKYVIGGEDIHNLTREVKILPMDVHLLDPQISASIMAGPKAFVGPGHDFLNNILPKGLRPTITFRARADIIRVDATLAEYSEVDDHCDKADKGKMVKPRRINETSFGVQGGEASQAYQHDVSHYQSSNERGLVVRSDKEKDKTFGFDITLRTGLVAWAQIFTFVFDTDSLGKFDKSPEGKRGLYFSKKVFGKCWPCHGRCLTDYINNAMGKIFDKINDGVNKVLHELTGALQDSDEDMTQSDKDLMKLYDKDKSGVDQVLNDDLGVTWKPGYPVYGSQVEVNTLNKGTASSQSSHKYDVDPNRPWYEQDV
jgi:hypothetical protein